MQLNGEQIIAGFHRYVDDSTELSPAEDLALANKKLHELANDRGWEWCRKTLTATISSDTTFVTLPDDFRFPVEDTEHDLGFAFYIGESVYPIFNYNQRMSHKGHAYFDFGAKKLYLPTSHITGAFQLDYYGEPDDLTLETYPPFRGGFHPIIYHMMAVDFEIMERSEKARSYRQENEAAIANYMEDMQYEDAEQKEWQNP